MRDTDGIIFLFIFVALFALLITSGIQWTQIRALEGHIIQYKQLLITDTLYVGKNGVVKTLLLDGWRIQVVQP